MPRPPKAVAEAIRWLASQGGKARAKAMTHEEMRRAMRAAVTARWARRAGDGKARAKPMTAEERSRAMRAAVAARWRKTTKAQRSAAASKAARARWAKKRKEVVKS
jgi:hypothetical protein